MPIIAQTVTRAWTTSADPQRALARRTAQWRDLLHPARSADRHRELEASLQYSSPACLDRLPGAGPRGVRARARRMAGCATATGFVGHAPAGGTANPKLTFQADHSVGAGQFRKPRPASKRARARL